MMFLKQEDRFIRGFPNLNGINGIIINHNNNTTTTIIT